MGSGSTQYPGTVSRAYYAGVTLFILDAEGLLKTKEKNQKLYIWILIPGEKKEKIQRYKLHWWPGREKNTDSKQSVYVWQIFGGLYYIIRAWLPVIFPIEEKDWCVSEYFSSRETIFQRSSVFQARQHIYWALILGFPEVLNLSLLICFSKQAIRLCCSSQGKGGGPGRGEAPGSWTLASRRGPGSWRHPEPSAVAAGPVRLLISHTLLGQVLAPSSSFPCLWWG